MHPRHLVGGVTLFVVVSLVAGCSSGSGSDTTDNSSAGTPSTAAVTTVAPTTTGTTPESTSTSALPTTIPSTTAPSTTAPSTTEVAPVQVALWPAANVVLATPEAAAADFVAHVVGAGPVLGAFQAGDQRSGEIPVFAADETGAPIGLARSTLLLRQLGPSDAWFVIGAVSDAATIITPEAAAAVPAGLVTVSGAASGFEANIGIRAVLVGAGTELAGTTAMAGNFGVPLPYSVQLDLSAASPGDTVVIIVHGGAGLETDPGDFSAIAVTIAG